MSGLVVSDMQWIKGNTRNGTQIITRELGKCVAAAVNLLGDVKRIVYGMKRRVPPCAKNVPAMLTFSVMAYNARDNPPATVLAETHRT